MVERFTGRRVSGEGAGRRWLVRCCCWLGIFFSAFLSSFSSSGNYEVPRTEYSYLTTAATYPVRTEYGSMGYKLMLTYEVLILERALINLIRRNTSQGQ